MTAREIYDHRIKRLPAIEQLRLAMVILEELAGPADVAARTELLLQQIRASAPSSDDLLSLAAKHQPPQSWWDESDDPFAPDDRAQ